MTILQINKFYYLRGGAERYFLNLSDVLEKRGHKVIPFSMAASENDYSPYNKYFINKVDVNKFNLKNAGKVLYNYDAARRLKILIKEERPDIAHLHNIAHQLSPSIIRTLRKYDIPIAQTLHDYKLICPNYLLFSNNEICYECEGGKYYNCVLKKCVKNSFPKSFLAAVEMYLHKNILKTYDKVDLFIAPSKFMKDACVRFGVPEKKIKVIYNFIESSSHSENGYDKDIAANVGILSASAAKRDERPSGARAQNDAAKSRSLIDMGEKYLLYFGRLSHEKGIDNLLEAMARNQESKKAIKQESNKGKGHEEEQMEIEKLEIKKLEGNERVRIMEGDVADKDSGSAGKTPPQRRGDLLPGMKLKIVGSGIEFKKLEDKIKELGMEDRVELVGQKFGQELINLIVKAHAVVIPSIWNENMPFSMLEAMAEGKVVIASRTGGIGEIIRDKENGFLFKYGNIDELAEKIQDLDKFDLNKIGQAAMKRVMELNETAHYRDIMEVYEKLRIKNYL